MTSLLTGTKKVARLKHTPLLFFPFLFLFQSLPKMEHYLEARLWNDIFRMAQDLLGVRRGSIRATVLIETITAAFQMDEIIYELREHSSGLNCGRWDC